MMGHYKRLSKVSAVFIVVAVVASIAFSGAASGAQGNAKTPPRDESVVGGKAVRDGQYAFVAGLLDKSRPGSAYDKQYCGGTLINKNSVLTAAHCVDGRNANSINVTVGRTVLSSNQGVIRAVKKIKKHPGFKGANVSSRYDAAVLKLKSPANNARPIRLSTPRNNAFERPGTGLIVAGWGNTIRQSSSGSSGSNYPNRMRQGKVPVVSDRQTASAYNRSSVPSALRFYPQLMVGAGKGGKDTCQGDSGGPLFKKTVNGFVQVGITSYGLGCAEKRYPGVYTEINSPSIRKFILNVS